MAEKRRSCQDIQVAPAGKNGSEDTSLAALTQSGSGPGGRACTFMPLFLLHHIIVDRGLVDGLGPDQPRPQGNLLRRRDWIQLRKIALSRLLLPTPGAQSANTSALDLAQRSVGPSGTVSAGRHRIGAQARSMALVQDVRTAPATQKLQERAGTSAFAQHRTVPAWAPSAWASVSVIVVLQGCHLTGCDSSLGHHVAPSSAEPLRARNIFGSGTSSNDPSMSLAAKPWEVGVQSRRSGTESPREEFACASRPLCTHHGRKRKNPGSYCGTARPRRGGARTGPQEARQAAPPPPPQW